MKKFLLTSAFSAMVLFASAQYDEGRLLVNGGLGFSSSSTSATMSMVNDGEAMDPITAEISTSTFNLNLRGYYFVSDNLAVGLGIGYGAASGGANLGGDELGDSLTMELEPLDLLSFSPSVRYYIPIERELSFFLQGDVQVGFGVGESSIEIGTASFATSLSAFGVGVQPGLSYMISRKFALEMTFGRLGFTQINSTTESIIDSENSSTMENTVSDFGLNLDSSTLTFGFSMLLN